MNTPLPLTEKEKNVLEFIEGCLVETGVSPSYQEIRDHFGFASFNSVQNYLKQLTQKGYIRNPNNSKRAIQVLHSSQTVQSQISKKLGQSKQSSVKSGSLQSSLLHTPGERGEVLSLPLLGKVAAGLPIESLEHDEYIDVPSSLVRNASKSFALRVMGQSMIEDGIFDGDIILVQKQASATNGEIVVASIDNESTVKRLFTKSNPEQPSGKLIELRPANSNMKSMWYPPEQVEIQGVVVGLIRKF